MLNILFLLLTASTFSPVAFEVPERDLFPESVAYDAADRSFYLGSMHKRKIVKIDRRGRVSDFISPAKDGLMSVLGMKIDPKRRELWANHCNFGSKYRPPMANPDPTTEGRAALNRYDLRTGKLIRSYTMKDPPAEVCFNDLVLAPSGDVYVSGGGGALVLREGSNHIEPYEPAGRLMSNGIALDDSGQTLFVTDHTKGVAVIDLASGSRHLIENKEIAGIDGLYFYRGSLLGVRNGSDPEAVVRAWLSPDFKSVARVSVMDAGHPRFSVPTTGVIVGDHLYYVATSQLDRIDAKNQIWPIDKLVPNVILKLKLGK